MLPGILAIQDDGDEWILLVSGTVGNIFEMLNEVIHRIVGMPV